MHPAPRGDYATGDTTVAGLGTPTLSVLMVTFRSETYIARALVALADAPFDWEIIVVDNASDDGTRAQLEQWRNRVAVIENDRNAGFAAATNIAYRRSRGKYVLTLNPDAEVMVDTIVRAVKRLDEGPTIGMVGPSPCLATLERWYMPLFYRRMFGERPPTSEGDVGLVLGTGLVVRRSALHRDYLFDERLFLFGEECELARYLTDRGWRIVVDPEYCIPHDWGGSGSRKAMKQLWAAEWLRRCEWYGRRSANLYELCALADALVLWSVAAVRRRPVAKTHRDRAAVAASLLRRGDAAVARIDSETRAAFATTVVQ
jgi:GT2 family glycosyltransferase